MSRFYEPSFAAEHPGCFWKTAFIGGAVWWHALVGCGASPPITFSPPQKIGLFEKETILESSGVASSLRNPDLFWTHNDSGDGPRLFAFSREGKHLGTSKVKRAENEDWEAIDSCTLDDQPYLLIGDLGDNAGKRQFAAIYVVPENEDPAEDSQATTRLDFAFAGGPVDCEAMGLDAERRELILIEKQARRLRSQVYLMKWPAELPIGVSNSGRANYQATKLATVPHMAVTALDISADNRHLLVNTYGDLFVYSRGRGETWQTAFGRAPVRIDGPSRQQGEAACFDHDSLDILITSEGKNAPLWRSTGRATPASVR